MQIGAKQMIVAGGAVAWLLVAVWAAAVGNGTTLRAATIGGSPPTVKAPAVFRPACGVNGYTQTGVPTARTVRGGVEMGAQGAPPSGQQISDQAFKNVQALKGIPVDEFMGTMGLFSAALGMCCLECHNEDWTFDTPRKRTARKAPAARKHATRARVE